MLVLQKLIRVHTEILMVILQQHGACLLLLRKSGLDLFIGSYPITPATGILEELAARKDLGVKSFQAEDEIAGICTAIGASFAGHLAVTTTSGPGTGTEIRSNRTGNNDRATSCYCKCSERRPFHRIANEN